MTFEISYLVLRYGWLEVTFLWFVLFDFFNVLPSHRRLILSVVLNSEFSSKSWGIICKWYDDVVRLTIRLSNFTTLVLKCYSLSTNKNIIFLLICFKCQDVVIYLMLSKHITPCCCSTGSGHPQSYPSGKHVFERSQNIPNPWPMHRRFQHQHQTLHQIQICNLWFEVDHNTNVYDFRYVREDPVLKNWAGHFL